MLFSIITPSFRQLDWLRLCMASVRDQIEQAPDWLSVEHLVEDAGSEGIDQLARDERTAEPGRYRLGVSSAPDRGMYDAINRGLSRSRGELLAYLNCDEQYLPGVLGRVATWFRDHPHVEVLFCDAIVVGADGTYLCDRRVTVPTVLHTRLSGNLSIFTSSTFFRRSVIERRGMLFDPSWRAAGDADWVIRMLEAGVPMATLPLWASVHTDTGANLALSPTAHAEIERLAAAAPWWARRARALISAQHRVRRLRAGAYALAPHRYAIYTRASPEARVEHVVSQPTFRWRR